MRDLTVFPSSFMSRCSTSFKSHGNFMQSFGLLDEPDTHSDECLLACVLTRRVGVCSWRSLSVWGKRSIGLRWLPAELSSEISDGRWRSDESLQLQPRSYCCEKWIARDRKRKNSYSSENSESIEGRELKTHRTWLFKAAWNIRDYKSSILS